MIITTFIIFIALNSDFCQRQSNNTKFERLIIISHIYFFQIIVAHNKQFYCYNALNSNSRRLLFRFTESREKQAEAIEAGKCRNCGYQSKRRPHTGTHRAHVYKETQVSNIHSNGHNIERQQQQLCYILTQLPSIFPLFLIPFYFSFSFFSLFAFVIFLFPGVSSAHRFGRRQSLGGPLLQRGREPFSLDSTILKSTFS